MRRCFFVSDLHGRPGRYRKLLNAAVVERPAAIFLGGDLFPTAMASLSAAEAAFADFIRDFLAPGFADLRARLGKAYPRVFLIPGNDDVRSEETTLQSLEAEGLWEYIQQRKVAWDDFTVFGYAYVPPTPFQLKDWERYDVSRYVDSGCVSPEEGWRSVPAAEQEIRHATIQKDLAALAGDADLSRAIFLFHTPPYQTYLDRAALDGKMVDHIPLDVHVGSIALRRFIEKRQPRITLHGHIHESARLTGFWKDRIGNTHLFSAAHDGPELALVRFDPEAPEQASRELL